MKHDW